MQTGEYSARAALPQSRGPHAYGAGTPLWQQLFAFVVGLSLEFNLLVGGSGEGVLQAGGYGYRFTDILAIFTLGLLALFSIPPSRYLPLGLFGLIVAVLFGSSVLSPDPRSSILAQHYILYSFAGLYIAVVLSEASAVSWFCWGMIVGLVATAPIFVLQDSGYASALIDWGLVPGYFQVLQGLDRDIPRYSGLWGHPNEAGHVAALAASAAAYLALVHRRLLPLALVGATFLVIFYYTWSRAGLTAGGVILVIPLLFVRRRLEFGRLALAAIVLTALLIAISQIDFVASRFTSDQNVNNNIGDRLESILYGIRLVFDHPFGTSMSEMFSLVNSETGGVGSVHNAFLFYAGVFGLLPLVILLVGFLANFRIRDDTDIFFAMLTFQVTMSFLFEILTASYSYVFVICIIVARAYLKTPVGAILKVPVVWNAQRQRQSTLS